MQPRSGPAHDRVELTPRENRCIARLERELREHSVRLATRSELRSLLTVRSVLLLAWLGLRRPAMALLALGGAGVALYLPTSHVFAGACAALSIVGVAATTGEVASRARARRLRRRRT